MTPSLATLVLLLQLRVTDTQEVFTLEPHPNHYVLLVDASGSAFRPSAKRRLMHSLLLEELPRHLYAEGFPPHVPAMDPELDLLTLFHFGIVTHPDEETAYLHIEEYDFLTEFIHPVAGFEARRGVEREELARSVIPETRYRYSVLSWAPRLALHQVSARGQSVARTFLVFVHDGLSNQHLPTNEVQTMRQFSDPEKFEAARRAMQELFKTYLVSDAAEPAWERPRERWDRRYPIFVEVHEVVPRAWQEWQQRGEVLPPLGSIEFQWLSERGTAPRGLLTGALRREFDAWRSEARLLESQLTVSDGDEVVGSQNLSPAIEVPIVVRGPLESTPRQLRVGLDLRFELADQRLGRRSVTYRRPAAEIVSTGVPRAFTVAYWVGFGGRVLLALGLLVLLALYLRGRLLTTGIRLKLPGHIEVVDLRRRHDLKLRTNVPPQPELEAFTLELPPRWRQRLFLRNARLTVEGRDGEAGWLETEGLEARLPTSLGRLHAGFKRLPESATTLRLRLEHGARHSEVAVSYPRGLALHR